MYTKYVSISVHGSRIYAQSGVVVSPLYPTTFHGSGQYTWQITTDGNYVAVTIEEMMIEMDSVQDICQSSLQVFRVLCKTLKVHWK